MNQARSVTATFNSTPSTTQKIGALYVGFFERAADFDGLNFWKWVAQNSGLSDLALMRSMAAGFANPGFTPSTAR